MDMQFSHLYWLFSRLNGRCSIVEIRSMNANTFMYLGATRTKDKILLSKCSRSYSEHCSYFFVQILDLGTVYRWVNGGVESRKSDKYTHIQARWHALQCKHDSRKNWNHERYQNETHYLHGFHHSLPRPNILSFVFIDTFKVGGRLDLYFVYLAESEEVQDERQTEGKGLKWTVHSCIYGIAKYRVYIASLNNESQDGGIQNKSNHPHDKEYDVFPSPIPKKMMQLAFSNNQVAIQTNRKCLQ